MKKAYVEGIHCKGCAKEIQRIFENIYGVSDVSVSVEEGYVMFNGYVSENVILDALADTNYELTKIEKISK